MNLTERIRACRLCADRFAATATGHQPRPVVWMRPTARVLIAGQAPGARVHQSGQPFTDASGVRLRTWLGTTEEEFYDRDRVAIVPMAFCFPGYDTKGADLPPPPICAETWRRSLLAEMPGLRLTVLVGGSSQRWHLGRPVTAGGVTATVARWREFAPEYFALPHPSWRNSGWLKRNPWFETDLLPAARAAIREALDDRS